MLLLHLQRKIQRPQMAFLGFGGQQPSDGLCKLCGRLFFQKLQRTGTPFFIF